MLGRGLWVTVVSDPTQYRRSAAYTQHAPGTAEDIFQERKKRHIGIGIFRGRTQPSPHEMIFVNFDGRLNEWCFTYHMRMSERVHSCEIFPRSMSSFSPDNVYPALKPTENSGTKHEWPVVEDKIALLRSDWFLDRNNLHRYVHHINTAYARG